MKKLILVDLHFITGGMNQSLSTGNLSLSFC